MENYYNADNAYSTDASSDSLDGVNSDVELQDSKSLEKSLDETHSVPQQLENMSAALSLHAPNTQTATAFGKQFQELVVHALMQSAASLMGPLPGLHSFPQEGSNGIPLLSIQGFNVGKNLNEAPYNIASARRKRKNKVMRTSI